MADGLINNDSYQCRYAPNDIDKYLSDRKKSDSIEKVFPRGDSSPEYPRFGQINGQRLKAVEALKVIKTFAKDALKQWLDDPQNQQLKYEVPFSLDVTQPNEYDPLYFRVKQIHENLIDQLDFNIFDSSDPRIASVDLEGKVAEINFRLPIGVAVAAVIHELIHPTQKPHKPFHFERETEPHVFERVRIRLAEEEARHHIDGEFEARVFGALIAMRAGLVNRYIRDVEFGLMLDSANFRECLTRQLTWNKCHKDLFYFKDLCVDFKAQPSPYESSYQRSYPRNGVNFLTTSSTFSILRGWFRYYR